jgi:hypothetical protein
MKRFTETTKWQDPWYRKLKPKHKCLWQYLCDSCDKAGVIDADWDLISFQIGEKVDESSLSVFEGRIGILNKGKLMIHGFIKFQYGNLSPECKPHKEILDLCDRHGIDPETGLARVSSTLTATLTATLPDTLTATLPSRVPSTLLDKDKDKEKTIKGECEGELIPECLDAEDFKDAWAQWQTHLKQKGVKRTPLAAKMQLKKLEGMGRQQAIAALHNSIAGNYQGIFEPKAGFGTPKPDTTPRKADGSIDYYADAVSVFGEENVVRVGAL